MKAYSEDLRQKVVQAIEQHGMSKSQAARLFGVSLSSVGSATQDSQAKASPSPPEREADDPPKLMRPQRGFSKRT